MALLKRPHQPRVAKFTQVLFSGKLDSKGRITIPARIRNKLSIEDGDQMLLGVESTTVVQKEFESEKDALEFLSGLEGIEQFGFSSGILEVVLNE